MSTTPTPNPTKPAKAQIGAGIAAATSTLVALQALLPVDGTAHLVIAIAIIVLGGLGTYFGIFQTVNEPLD
jgi:hypothetical protein